VHGCCNFLVVGALAVVVAEPAQTQDTSTWSQTDPRYGFLTPIPDHGAVPPIVQMALRPAPQELGSSGLDPATTGGRSVGFAMSTLARSGSRRLGNGASPSFKGWKTPPLSSR
jgi:hypothetical protein